MIAGLTSQGWPAIPLLDTLFDPRDNVARATIERLLQAEAYDELTRLIAARRAAAPVRDDPGQLAVLNAVEQLCQTCVQLRQLRRDHERALQQAARVEADTRRRLEQLLVAVWPDGAADPAPAAEHAADAGPIARLRAAFRQWRAATAAADPSRAATAAADETDHLQPDEPAPAPSLALPAAAADAPPATPPVAAYTPLADAPPATLAVADDAPPADPPLATPALRFYCLGEFHAFAGERPIDDWTSLKSRSLLKYLLLHRDRPATAEQLLTVFWPDSPPETARRSLYQTIYLLRRTVRPPGDRPSVVQVNGGYLLNPDLDLWIDGEVFLCRYREGIAAGADSGRAVAALAAAEALYGGDLMAEEVYEDWPVARREEARDAYLDILDRLSRHYEAAGDDENCLAYGRKLLDLDNCREDIYRRLMRVYARRGERSLALRQYHRCVAALRAELDVDPLPETTALYAKLLKNGDSAEHEHSLNPI